MIGEHLQRQQGMNRSLKGSSKIVEDRRKDAHSALIDLQSELWENVNWGLRKPL